MSKKNTIVTAYFVQANFLKKIPLRSLHLKNLRNSKWELLKEEFVIDESPELQAIGPLSSGEIISFEIDDDFNVIKFIYPHGELNERNK